MAMIKFYRSAHRFAAVVLSAFLLTAVSLSAQVFNKPSNTITNQKPAPTGIKTLIVVDFYVPDGAIKKKEGLLQNRPIRRGIFGQDDDKDTDQTLAKAKKDAALLATTLVAKLNDNEDLKKLGISAERDSVPTDKTDADTLVIDGAFVFVDEGGRLLQTGIGFGAGASKVEIEAEILDYSQQPPVQIMKVGSHSNPRRAPGAILMMNPYVAAAKFVMSKDSSEKDIKKVAAGLAKEIAAFLTGKTQPAPTTPAAQ